MKNVCYCKHGLRLILGSLLVYPLHLNNWILLFFKRTMSGLVVNQLMMTSYTGGLLRLVISVVMQNNEKKKSVLSNRQGKETFRQLRVRDLLNTKQCSRVNHRHFGGKTWYQLWSVLFFLASWAGLFDAGLRKPLVSAKFELRYESLKGKFS